MIDVPITSGGFMVNNHTIKLFQPSYSVLNDFTGLAIAAFKAFRPTVKNAILNVTAAAIAKTHQCSGVRYAKFCSQLFIA